MLREPIDSLIDTLVLTESTEWRAHISVVNQ